MENETVRNELRVEKVNEKKIENAKMVWICLEK